MTKQQKLKELLNEYKQLLLQIGRKECLIDTYDELEGEFDFEEHEINEWYYDDLKVLPELYNKMEEIEKKLNELENP